MKKQAWMILGAIGSLVLSTGAQQSDRSKEHQSGKYDSGQSGNRYSGSQGSSKQNQQGSKQGQQGMGGSASNLRLEPQSWVAVGYDFDGDGSYDAVEYVFGYDLMRAREQSDARARQQGTTREMQGRRATEAGFRRDTSDRSFDQGRSAKMQRTSGEIRSMKHVEFVGQDEPHMLVQIETQSGKTATVDLGPRSGISRANLQQGDRIEVSGRTGKADDRTMLMADRVRHDGQEFRIDRTSGTNLRRFQGRIEQIREVQYQGLDEEHLQARIQLQQGNTAVVDLGAKSDLSDAQLSQGKRIEFLADRVRINGEPGLRAEQVRIDGRKFSLDREQERQRLKSQSQRQGQGQSSRQSGSQMR